MVGPHHHAMIGATDCPAGSIPPNYPTSDWPADKRGRQEQALPNCQGAVVRETTAAAHDALDHKHGGNGHRIEDTYGDRRVSGSW
ncbi:MAG: hypothetical protein CYG59_26435 [Chloroflexi bacterium]|nr:MAG: hypothetical protein CYG59_26435 [Chloroflexota bacterium]